MSEHKQELIQAGRKRIHERRRAADEAEAAAQAERLKLLEDWAAAKGIDVGPIDHLLLELVSRSPSACEDIAGIIAKGGPVHREPPSGVQHA
jgi:hypothetical protein